MQAPPVRSGSRAGTRRARAPRPATRRPGHARRSLSPLPTVPRAAAAGAPRRPCARHGRRGGRPPAARRRPSAEPGRRTGSRTGRSRAWSDRRRRPLRRPGSGERVVYDRDCVVMETAAARMRRTGSPERDRSSPRVAARAPLRPGAAGVRGARPRPDGSAPRPALRRVSACGPVSPGGSSCRHGAGRTRPHPRSARAMNDHAIRDASGPRPSPCGWPAAPPLQAWPRRPISTSRAASRRPTR